MDSEPNLNSLEINTLIYDDSCGFCLSIKNLTEKYIIPDNVQITWIPFSSKLAESILNTLNEDRYESMIYIDQNHEMLRYDDAITAILRLNNKLAPTIIRFENSKLFRSALRGAYIWIARHRSQVYKLIPRSFRVSV